MSGEGRKYIHGTHPEEQARLSKLNDLLNEASLGAMCIEGGEKILDVGCGLGQLTRAMARQAQSGGHVIGVEDNAAQLEGARRQAAETGETHLVEFREGDAVDLPLDDSEWGTFDVAHARFLLEHVPDPQAVVKSMIRAVRTGGRIILEDDDHDVLRLWPEPSGVEKLWRAYIEAFKKLGNDPFVGRRLVAMLREAGAERLTNQWLFFGSCAGNPTFGAFVQNFVGILEGAADAIVATSLVERDDLDRGIAAFWKWGKRPDAALWYGTFWAEGRRP